MNSDLLAAISAHERMEGFQNEVLSERREVFLNSGKRECSENETIHTNCRCCSSR